MSNGQLDPQQQLTWLAQQLDDAHLVIGQQQVLLMRQQRRLVELEQQLNVKEEAWQDSRSGSPVPPP